MKRPHHKGRELLPLSVIHAAQAGDAEATEQILRYYGGYINKLCTRKLYDAGGFPRWSSRGCCAWMGQTASRTPGSAAV